MEGEDGVEGQKMESRGEEGPICDDGVSNELQRTYMRKKHIRTAACLANNGELVAVGKGDHGGMKDRKCRGSAGPRPTQPVLRGRFGYP